MTAASNGPSPSLRGRLKFVRRMTNELKVLQQNLVLTPDIAYSHEERTHFAEAILLLIERAESLTASAKLVELAFRKPRHP